MAACSLLVGTADTGGTPNTSGSFTPTAGSLLLIFVYVDDTVDTTLNITNSAGGTYTKIRNTPRGTNTDMLFCYAADAGSTASSQTITVNPPTDPGNGTIIFVYEVTGMTNFGAAAVRQSGAKGNGGTGDTLEVAFDAAGTALTGNPTIVCMANVSSPSGVTEPSGWTEPASGDLSFATPTSSAETAFRNSGFTGGTISWTTTNSATGWCGISVELDASAPAGGNPSSRRFGMCPYTGRGPFGVPGLGYF